MRVLALVDGYVRSIVLAGIDLIGPKQFILPQLLQPMGQPARYSRHGKERGKEVDVDPHLVIDDARVEVDVGINALAVQGFSGCDD